MKPAESSGVASPDGDFLRMYRGVHQLQLLRHFVSLFHSKTLIFWLNNNLGQTEGLIDGSNSHT